VLHRDDKNTSEFEHSVQEERRVGSGCSHGTACAEKEREGSKDYVRTT